MIKILDTYLHGGKEQTWDYAKILGIDPDSDAAEQLAYVNYEVHIRYEVDTDTGKSRIVAVDNVDLIELKEFT